MQRVLGLMSGTSMDAVDVAWLRTDGEAQIEAGPAASYAYLPAEREAIRAVLGQHPARGRQSEQAAEAVTEAHRRAINRFFDDHPELSGNTDLIGFHGQTTFHDPDNCVTVQIGDASALSRAFNLPVIHDFRSADVAAGGQGAPLAPLYHAALADGLRKPLAVLNLGGVGNVTWLGSEGGILAFDTGPASALMDDWAQTMTGEAFDRNGQMAASGSADNARVAAWLAQPYFAQKPPKSLDRYSFSADVSDLNAADGMATLAEFTVQSVAGAVLHLPQRPDRWLVCGGGRHNTHLMNRLAEALAAAVEPVERAGWNGDALEAQAFAWLAVRSQRGLPLSLPTTTGVPEPCSGGRVATAA